MGCPVHIWAPLMTGLVPFARVARDRVRVFRAERRPQPAAKRTVQRFAPVAPGGVPTDASKAAPTEA